MFRQCVCFFCVRTSFQKRCPSAYQPAGSQGTARHFAAKPQTVTRLLLFSIITLFSRGCVNLTSRRCKKRALEVKKVLFFTPHEWFSDQISMIKSYIEWPWFCSGFQSGVIPHYIFEHLALRVFHTFIWKRDKFNNSSLSASVPGWILINLKETD